MDNILLYYMSNSANKSINTINNLTSSDQSKVTSNLISTLLSNERTYLAYMRTGLSLVVLAIPFKRYYIILIGILIIILSTIKYYLVSYYIDKEDYRVVVDYLNYLPALLTVIFLFIFFKEYKNVIKLQQNFNNSIKIGVNKIK